MIIKKKLSERYILTFLAHLNSNTVYICRAAKANSINIKNILFQFCLSYISYKKTWKGFNNLVQHVSNQIPSKKILINLIPYDHQQQNPRQPTTGFLRLYLPDET